MSWMKPFTANVLYILKRIPKGKVMTYGQIARAAGSPRGARQAVRILHSMSRKYDLPWHRVINVKGQVVLKDEEAEMNQREVLMHEVIKISEDGIVNLEVYQHRVDLGVDEDA